MKDMHITGPKGMNSVTNKTLAAKDRGMITDGVDPKKGYKVVSAESTTPKATSTVNNSKN